VTPAVLFWAIAGGFAIGSIPFGVIVGRLFFHTDIRASGSGNIGAANALRTFGRMGGAAVLVFDVLKGFGPTAFALRVDPLAAVVCATAAILGHCFSPWLGFRGGKGVATMLGALIALSWEAALVAVAIWLAAIRLTRYSSVASLAACASAPLALWFITRNPGETLFGVAAALFIVWTHRENIERLRGGREHTIGLGRRPTGSKTAPP
jgi:glycerol-3-phosphate acyltransferase PlsY